MDAAAVGGGRRGEGGMLKEKRRRAAALHNGTFFLWLMDGGLGLWGDLVRLCRGLDQRRDAAATLAPWHFGGACWISGGKFLLQVVAIDAFCGVEAESAAGRGKPRVGRRSAQMASVDNRFVAAALVV